MQPGSTAWRRTMFAHDRVAGGFFDDFLNGGDFVTRSNYEIVGVAVDGIVLLTAETDTRQASRIGALTIKQDRRRHMGWADHEFRLPVFDGQAVRFIVSLMYLLIELPEHDLVFGQAAF